MNQIDEALTKLYLEIQRKEKVAIHLRQLKTQIELKTNELSQLDEILAKESKDLDRLEKTNLYTLFQFILGNKATQLERERQEYLQTYLKRKSVFQNIRSLKKEQEILERNQASRYNIEETFSELVEKKEALLKAYPNYKEQIEVHNKSIAAFKMNIEAIENTIRKGNTARKHVHKVIIDLGKVDIWGELQSNAGKSKLNRVIDRVHKDIYIARKYLQKYENELIEISAHFQYDHRKQVLLFDQLVDQFIDSLITDWVVKSQIVNALSILNNIVDKISRMNASLEYELTKVEAFLAEEEEAKAKSIIELQLDH